MIFFRKKDKQQERQERNFLGEVMYKAHRELENENTNLANENDTFQKLENSLIKFGDILVKHTAHFVTTKLKSTKKKLEDSDKLFNQFIKMLKYESGEEN